MRNPERAKNMSTPKPPPWKKGRRLWVPTTARTASARIPSRGRMCPIVAGPSSMFVS